MERVKSEEYHAEGLTSSLTCEGGGGRKILLD